MISNLSRTDCGWSTVYHGLVLDVLMQDREVCNIGQFTRQQRRLLDRAVKAGDLSTHPAAGPYPKPKRCYAAPGYDFIGARERSFEELEEIAAWEAGVRNSHGQPRKVTGLRS